MFGSPAQVQPLLVLLQIEQVVHPPLVVLLGYLVLHIAVLAFLYQRLNLLGEEIFWEVAVHLFLKRVLHGYFTVVVLPEQISASQ